MNRLRSALKPGQDFCQASCQKTCPYGHKESEACHSVSVPLRCTPSERQSSSHQQYPRLRPGYIKEKRSGDFRLSPPANLANSAILPTAKISTFLCKISLLRKSKDSIWSMPPLKAFVIFMLSFIKKCRLIHLHTFQNPSLWKRIFL